MRTDVKALLAALTTERELIDRAIAGLKALSPAAQMEAAPKPRTERKARRTRVFISTDVKRRVVEQMADARRKGQSLTDVANGLARAIGCRPMTIQTNWRSWQVTPGVGANGNNGVTTTDAPVELTVA